MVTISVHVMSFQKLLGPPSSYVSVGVSPQWCLLLKYFGVHAYYLRFPSHTTEVAEQPQ